MLARLIRHRAWLVLTPLVVGLLVAGAVGARMLWEPTEADGAATVTCWDGSQHPRIDCERPTGAAGLSWVFPSFHSSDRRCHRLPPPADVAPPTPYTWRCRTRLGSTPVLLTYAVRSTLARGRAAIAGQYPGVAPITSATTKRTVWRDVRPTHGRWSLVEAYRDYPYSVTVSAGSREARDRALATLVRFRPAPYVVVRPPAS